MKLKYCLAIAGFAMAICSCDEGTDNIGMSLTSSNDNINVSTHEFNVLTESFVPDSVYTYNNELYLGRITDPETDITVASSFMMQFNMVENTMMPEKKEITDAHNGTIVADSCVIYLTFDASKTFGDSTTAMKLRLSELDHPVADGVHYTNFDPVKEGYIREGGLSVSRMYTYHDLTVKDSLRALSTYQPTITIRLNKPYTDKNGVTYNNYGTYIIQNYYDHPQYFKNSYTFTHQLCPGFNVETTDGQGLMAHFTSAQMIIYYTYQSDELAEELEIEDNKFSSFLSVSSTDEVLQTITVKNDKAALKKLAETDQQFTYMKTPAGIFNYNNKYAFYTSLSKNAYSFSNSSDINNLITKMYNDRNTGLKSDPNWVEKHPNWNKAILLPVGEIKSATSSSTSSTPIALIHEMGVTSTRLKRSTSSDPIKMRVIYAHFND